VLLNITICFQIISDKVLQARAVRSKGAKQHEKRICDQSWDYFPTLEEGVGDPKPNTP